MIPRRWHRAGEPLVFPASAQVAERGTVRVECELLCSPRAGDGERGAMLVLAVFMAFFLVAILYYSIGIGESVLAAEALQDSVDAGVLSSAILHARGMNFVVLLNVVMAAIMAVLIVVRLVEGLAMIGIVVSAALSWVTFGASAGLIPLFEQLRARMDDLYRSLQEPVSNTLRVLHDVADSVKSAIPPMAERELARAAPARKTPAAASNAAFYSVGV